MRLRAITWLAVTMVAAAATSAAADRIAALCASGHLDVAAVLLRPDDLTRAMECAAGLGGPDIDHAALVLRLVDDFGRGQPAAHEHILATVLQTWQRAMAAGAAPPLADPGQQATLRALAARLPSFAGPLLRTEVVAMLTQRSATDTATVLSNEAERLAAELLATRAADPAVPRLIKGLADAAAALGSPLLADVLARIIELAPDPESVAAARATVAELLTSAAR
jgi:hypothetical protein